MAARPHDAVVQRAAPPPEPEPPKLALVGAIVGEAEAIAIFLDQENSDAVVRLRVGQDHAGWVLNSVKGREAILQRDSESAVYVLPAPIGAPVDPSLHGNVINPVATPAANPTTAVPPGTLVLPSRPGDFAPFVPASTPKNGESDGL